MVLLALLKGGAEMFDMRKAVRGGNEAYKTARAICALVAFAWILAAALMFSGIPEGRFFLVAGMGALIFLPNVTQHKAGDMSVTTVSFSLTLGWVSWALLMATVAICGATAWVALEKWGWFWAALYAVAATAFVSIMLRHMLASESAPRGHAAS